MDPWPLAFHLTVVVLPGPVMLGRIGVFPQPIQRAIRVAAAEGR
jgi:hypothetical protein